MQIESTFAPSLYDAARRAAGLGAQVAETPRGASFTDVIAEAAAALRDTLARGDQAATQAVQGRGDVQSVVEALSATEMALQTAVAVRDRVVEAYQEILRMPV